MTPDSNRANPFRSARVLIIGLTATIVVLALAVVGITIGTTAIADNLAEGDARVNVLTSSTNDCVECHQRATPGIVEQYGVSAKAAAGVLCEDCHVVDESYPGAVAHEGTFVLNEPTTAMCQDCHSAEVAQFNASRHALPAYVAYAGSDPLSEEHLQMLANIPEAGFRPEGVLMRNALHAIEGPAVTKFACETCHDVGKPALDGSVGQCSKCHLRHEFSLEQARKPETCNQCHIGPDHPQWEIYQESPHGIAYATGGDRWHWEAEPGTLTVADFPAPTCATCHFSGFGAAGTTHDAGDRLTWFLYAPISARRPAWQDNQVRMQAVCRECHNTEFIETFYADADAATEQVNAWVAESDRLIAPLRENELLTQAPFDESIEFVHFELWHHWGRTAKFGAWMQGPDYTQWHGAYELIADMVELEEMVKEYLEAAGLNAEDIAIDPNVLPVGEVGMPSPEEMTPPDAPTETE